MSDAVGSAAQAPDSAAGEWCKYCGMTNCPMHGSEAVEARASAEVVPPDAVHTMAGVPPPIAIGGVAIMIVLTHLILARRREP